MKDSELNRDRLRQIVEDPNFKAAVDRVKEDCVNNWRETTDDPADSVLRERYWHLDQAADMLVAKLINMAHEPTSL